MLTLWRRHLKACPHRRKRARVYEVLLSDLVRWRGERRARPEEHGHRGLGPSHAESRKAGRPDVRPCVQPGCSELVERGRCTRHSKEVARAILAFHEAHQDVCEGTRRNRRSYTEQFIDSAGMFVKLSFPSLAASAKQESVRRSERASAAYARLKSQGKTDHLGRKRLIVDRQQIRDLATGGMSVRAIAAKLKISHTSVHRIVQGRA